MSDTKAQDLTTEQITEVDTKNHATQQATKPLRPATRKEKAYARYLVENPKATQAEAYKATYNTKGHLPTIEAEASRTANKPQVRLEIAKYSQEAESVMLEVMQQSRKKMTEDTARAVDWAVNARQTADSILDRTHGKATTKIEQQSTTVTLSLSLKDITGQPNTPAE